MLSIIHAAGWPIWPLLFTSLLAVAFIVERGLALRRQRILPDELLGEVLSLARRPQLPPETTDRLSVHSVLGRVLAAGLQHRTAPRAVIENALAEAGRVAAHDMQRYLNGLGTIAAVAPLMGLFGTVIGMIEIFAGWSPTGGDPAQLARGISIALYNTALGILVAIPALIFQRMYRARVAGYLLEMEQAAGRLLDTLRPVAGSHP